MLDQLLINCKTEFHQFKLKLNLFNSNAQNCNHKLIYQNQYVHT